MIGKSHVVLLALLLALPTAFLGAAVLTTQAQTTYSAWLKIVTDSWDGDSWDNLYDPDLGYKSPVFPVGRGFADRYNATNVCVLLVHFKAGLTQWDPPINAGSPNGTGFIRVSWPSAWPNLTIIVKAKSYQGECIGGNNPFEGIIVYWLTVNGTRSFLQKFFGTTTIGNYTIGDDGMLQSHPGPDFDFRINAPFNAGPVDHMDMYPAWFAAAHSDPRNASVAHAAYIFKLFHEHTWYSIKDNLTYATIFIYDVDHTSATSSASLIQAAVTGPDGRSRYTREIFPTSAGVGTGKFAQNRLVPIPLQSINLRLKTPFEGGFGDDGSIEAPHLNATKRVWWETVLTNQTFYVGNVYNGTLDYDEVVDGTYIPLFGAFPTDYDANDDDTADDPVNPTITQGGLRGVPAGPFSLALNHTVPAASADGFAAWELDEDIVGVANLNNNTVFYARFCVQDADLKIQHPEVGDKLVGAEITLNFKTRTDTPYYLSHSIHETDDSGCIGDPHKWPGYLSQFRNFARFPNGTNWGLRGSLNVSKHFDPRDDRSRAWSPGGFFERAWGGDWDGPWRNAGRNWSALVPEITYMKTRALTDDKDWDGFSVEVKWKGGSRNSYGGQAVLVDSVRVKNPYAIAALYDYEGEDIFGEWVFPYTTLANNKFWLMIHAAEQIDIGGEEISPVHPTWLEIMGPFALTLSDYDYATGTFTVTITALGPVVVNNATDPESVVDWTLSAGDEIQIENALVSFKKHDIFPVIESEELLLLGFAGSQGQADLGADGSNDYTSVGFAEIFGGPMEVEFWPGPPGTGTIRVLISGHDINYVLPGTPVSDFTGAILLKGPPQLETFFVLGELEELEIEGEVPEGGNNLVVDDTTTTSSGLALNGGILSVGPIVKARITGMNFDATHGFTLQSVFEDMTLSGTAIDTTITADFGPIPIDGEQDFSISLTGFPEIDIVSFVVPLTDIGVDNQHLDNKLFGGYDDFALTGTGLVYITAWVHDIAFKIVDNMGNVLPSANTAVTLTRTNGGPIVRSDNFGAPDQLQGNLRWSYDQWAGAEKGYAIFYQLPGDQAYGITVTFEGQTVYDERFQIEKLTETVIETIVANVFKLKLVFIDCEGQLLDSTARVRITSTSGFRYQDIISDTGALDLIVAGGDMTIHGVWWKGIWVPFDQARIGTRDLTLNRDGSLTITLDRNIDAPITLRALINNIIITPYDYNLDNKIPRLNITLTWVGEHPQTGRRMYFLQTLDPTGDRLDGDNDGYARNDFNTSLDFSQFLKYRIEYRQGQVTERDGLKTYGLVQYIFYKMPPTYYNITVTTVANMTEADGTPKDNFGDWVTPATSKWPGRDVPVDYEIKIDWTSHTSPPRIRRTPATIVDDRVVLRVFGTIGGIPVTDPNLNPGGVGNQTWKVCGPRQIDLATWAHTFYKRVVDGDFDYLREARRIGNATFNIVNDNGQQMEEYYPDTKTFSPDFVSRWTSDLLDTTRLKADSQYSSNIWWNGSYRAENLRFLSYVYPLEFGRGEEPWARFYNRVGLTGTGILTTEDGPMDHDNDVEVTPNSFLIDRFFNLTTSRTANATWPTHNFTVVGNEGLWAQQRWRWESAVARRLVPEVPSRPSTLVFEKETVTFPIPVGFITLSLKDEDLARAVPFAVVELSIFTRTSKTDRIGTLAFSAVYKTGASGNLTLLYPTQEMYENFTMRNSPNTYVRNYTLTVYWYLNSSIVYRDAFNLTKRGYSADKTAIADVTFVLAISADTARPVKDLFARIWWLNVTDPDARAVFPGRIAADSARRTITYTAVPETRGAAKWTTGSLTLPWLPTSERFTKSDWDLAFDSAAGRWVYRSVTRTWDIPFPSDDKGRMLDGWPYSPRPSGYVENGMPAWRSGAITQEQNRRIQYRISVWSDQLPIDPASPAYGRGAWARAAPAAAAGDHYELVWTRLSTGDTTPPIFRFAWMLFGEPPFDITWYRGPDGLGGFEPIPGYALTRTSVRTPSPGAKTVAIKLNATDIEIPVFWQVGDLELGSYDCGPLVGYRVTGSVIPPRGATFPAITFDRTTSAGKIRVGGKVIDICITGKDVGLVSLRSGDTPSTVFWGGSTLRITAVAPPERIWADDREGQDGADNPNRGTTSTYWSDYIKRAIDPITGRPVNLVTGDQLRIPGVDLGIQYMGYGTAFEGRPREHRVIAFSNDPDNRAHRPFIKMFEFQNVSARITDFNGRPLAGAFYQLIDAQTGKSAAWSYSGPDGRIVPMPIRKPGGVFIQRVFYLGQGANGDPTWPVNSFAKWPIAYDSRDDETTQETQKPDIPLGFAYAAEAGPWPIGDGWADPLLCRLVGDGVYDYDIPELLEILASCPPAGWGRSFDVITRIFDLRIRFVYGDAQRPADPAYVFSAPSLALPERFNIAGQGSIVEIRRIARGTYDIVAFWPAAGGAEVGRRTFDVSRANVGTVEGTVVLALRDVSFTVVDRQGRPVTGARVAVSPELVRSGDVQLRPDGIFTLLRVPDGRTYDFTIEWTSVYGTTARAAVRDTPAGLQSRGSITIPVDDVTITVVDFDGRPVAGAAITFAGQAVGSTDSQGVIVVGQVPLDNTYAVTVTKDGTQIGSDNIRFTASRLTATLQAGVYDITVLVKGAAGQPIQGATVELIRGGTTIATAATDPSGAAVFSKVVGADYTVRATYEQFSRSESIARGTRSATVTLDLYTVLLGVPMTFATFLALIIGLILLVIVVIVIVSEYIRWRGRRLGIYPAAPPKK